jgi:hypothetical protein
MTKQLTSMMVEIRKAVPGEPDAVDSWQDQVRAIKSGEL